MKSSILILAFAAILSISFAGQVSAQTLSDQPVAESQKVELRTSLPSRASNENGPSLSTNSMQMMTRSSINAAILAQSQQIVAVAAQAMQSNIATSLKTLEEGGVHNITMPLNTSNVSISNLHSVRVHVEFEARPIGGVLTVRVEMMPQFSGIGVANRAIASKTMTTAVDNLDATTVNGYVNTLSMELASQIANGKLN